jgi:hypothetical protein
MCPVALQLCAQSCVCLVRERAWRGASSLRPSSQQVDINPCSAVALRPTGWYGSHRLAARRRPSARRADSEAVIGSSCQCGGGQPSRRVAARRQPSARRAEATLQL